LKRGENEAKKSDDDVTLFFSTNAQHYTSLLIFSIRGVLFCLFSIYLQKQKQTHSLINELYKTYHILMRFFLLEAISKKKLALYRRIEMLSQQNKKRRGGRVATKIA
jgi:hypothetical protein